LAAWRKALAAERSPNWTRRKARMGARAKALTRGTILNAVSFAATAVISLGMMPIIQGCLGDRNYGFWIIVGTTIGYFWFADLGIGSAIERYVAREVAATDSGRVDRINQVFNNGFFFFLAGGVVLFLVACAICLALPLFLKNRADVWLFRMVFLIVGADFALAFPLRAYSGIVRAHLLFDAMSVVYLVALMGRTVLILWLLAHGGGLIKLALATAVVELGVRGAQCYYAYKCCPGLRVSYKLVNLSKAKELYAFGWFSLLITAASQLRNNMDNFVIGGVLGLERVTPYSFASRLIAYYLKFVGMIFEMTMPFFSQLEKTDDSKSITRKFYFMLRINVYIAWYVGGVLICLGRPFLNRWVGANYDFVYPLLVVLTLACLCYVAQRSTYEFLRGTSRHKFCAYLDLVEGFSNLALSIVLAHFYGLMGVAVGTLAPVLLAQALVVPRYVSRKVGLSLRQYYAQLLGDLARGGVFMVACYFVARMIARPSYPRLVLASIAITAVYGACVLALGFSKDERAILFGVLRSTARADDAKAATPSAPAGD
jgi:O-antigen/teichoic acid export membrane protein